jgi:phospholipid-binding lipoprotein MlaA
MTIRPNRRLPGGISVRLQRTFAACLLAASVAACATPPTDPVARAVFEETNDPFEPTNRAIFEFNRTADRYVIKPVAQGYREVVPEPGRRALRNFLDNLRQPVVFANNIMQGEVSRAFVTLARFTVNSTVGGLGLFDVATDQGYPRQQGDFGQTLFVWGVPDGPFLMLPLLGPSNPRDAIGYGVDAVMDPFGYWADSTAFDISRTGARGIDQREQVIEELDNIERTSIDFYATIRSLWRQSRTEDLYHGRPPAPSYDNGLYQDPGATK